VLATALFKSVSLYAGLYLFLWQELLAWTSSESTCCIRER